MPVNASACDTENVQKRNVSTGGIYQWRLALGHSGSLHHTTKQANKMGWKGEGSPFQLGSLILAVREIALLPETDWRNVQN